MRSPRTLSTKIANQLMRFAKFGQAGSPPQASRHIEVAEHRRRLLYFIRSRYSRFLVRILG
jgi:hypothetical protein